MKHKLNLGALIACAGLCSASTALGGITQGPGPISDTQWTLADSPVVLNGFTYVLDGVTLTIDPGVVVYGRPVPTGAAFIDDNGDAVPHQTSALFVCRGGKLIAEGTSVAPIIFTIENDDTTNPNDTDAVFASWGLETGGGCLNQQGWGGVVLFGNARINSADEGTFTTATPVEQLYEGIVSRVISGQRVHYFGGTDDNDSSGSLRFVSIRHAGKEFATAKELNGLSMGGIGAGTSVEYVEVFANSDDGFEWWGGNANARCLVAAFVGDDSFDFDQGYRGNNQYLLSVSQPNRIGDTPIVAQADNGSEQDGSVSFPRNVPEMRVRNFNATLMGYGANDGHRIRDLANPSWYNGNFNLFAEGVECEADIQIAGLPTVTYFNNNTFSEISVAQFNAATPPSVIGPGNDLTANISIGGRAFVCGAGTLDPRPVATGDAATPINTGIPIMSGSYTTPFLHRGGFAPAPAGVWCAGWTALDHYGFLAPAISGAFVDIQEGIFIEASSIVKNGANMDVTFPTTVGKTYVVTTTADDRTYTRFSTQAGTGAPITVTVPAGAAYVSEF